MSTSFLRQSLFILCLYITMVSCRIFTGLFCSIFEHNMLLKKLGDTKSRERFLNVEGFILCL